MLAMYVGDDNETLQAIADFLKSDENKSELEYLFTVNPLQESGSEKYDRIESEISFGDILPSPRKNKAKGSLMTPREGYA